MFFLLLLICLFNSKISELRHFDKGMFGFKVKIPVLKKDVLGLGVAYWGNSTFFLLVCTKKKHVVAGSAQCEQET